MCHKPTFPSQIRAIYAQSGSSAVAQCVYEQRKRRRRLPPARVVEVIARIGKAPIREDAPKAALAEVRQR